MAATAPAAAQHVGNDGDFWLRPEVPPAPRPRFVPGTKPRPAAEPRPVPVPRAEPPERQRQEPRMAPRADADAEPPKAPAPPPEPPRPPLGGRKAVVPFKASPFPYDGPVPPDGKPFLDAALDDKRGRLSARASAILWEEETYSDRSVLLYLTKGFSTARPGLIVLFFHGNGTRLVRDVERRQAVLHQVEASGLNAAVVAPQLAVDAPDSSAGAFWRPGMLATFLDEAAVELAKLYLARKPSARRPVDVFRHLPVVIVAYSGGYLPAAWVLHHGGADERIAGVVVLDGLYGEQAKFADWIERRRDAFFVSAFGASSLDGNMELRRLLGEREVRQLDRLDGRLAKGSVALIPAPADAKHAEFVTQAWAKDPIADLLRRLPRL